MTMTSSNSGVMRSQDSELLKAIRSKKISDSTKQKITDTIILCATMAGVSKVPTGFDAKVIVGFVQDQYQNRGINELIQAFKIYASGKMKNVEHYNTLSPAFIGKVMTAYEDFRADEIHKDKQLKEQRKRIEQQKIEPSPEQDKKVFNSILKHIKENKELPKHPRLLSAWDHAERSGIIKLSNDQKQEFKDQVIEQLKNETIAGNAALNITRAQLANEGFIKNECRRRYMEMYFNQLIDE